MIFGMNNEGGILCKTAIEKNENLVDSQGNLTFRGWLDSLGIDPATYDNTISIKPTGELYAKEFIEGPRNAMEVDGRFRVIYIKEVD